MNTTRESREAFAREYWPEGPKPGTHGHSWLNGHIEHGVWDAAARAIERAIVQAPVARPLDEWHEDCGDVLWWKLPVNEPPYVGSPLYGDWPGHHTHWTPIVCPREP